MSGAALKKRIEAVEAESSFDLQDHRPNGNDSGSPVHAMQARLEAAVFASFSDKEAAPVRRVHFSRFAVIVGAAMVGGALFMGGIGLRLL